MLGLMAEAISMRSFSTLWYWLSLAAFWVGALRGVLGLPHGMVAEARQGGEPLARFERAAQVQAQLRRARWDRWQIWIVAAHAGVIGGLSVLGFFYGIELAAALFFIAAPYTVLAAMNLRLAGHILGEHGQGAALFRVIFYFNIYLQLIAVPFILLTIGFAFVHMANAGMFR